MVLSEVVALFCRFCPNIGQSARSGVLSAISAATARTHSSPPRRRLDACRTSLRFSQSEVISLQEIGRCGAVILREDTYRVKSTPFFGYAAVDARARASGRLRPHRGQLPALGAQRADEARGAGRPGA